MPWVGPAAATLSPSPARMMAGSSCTRGPTPITKACARVRARSISVPGMSPGRWGGRAGTCSTSSSPPGGDFDGDGFNDLLARNASGQLFLYPGDGDGGWLPTRQVGAGWNVFDSILGPGDFNGDGTNDVLARNAAGDLFLYPGNGNGGWLAPSKVGWGWQVMNKIILAAT